MAFKLREIFKALADAEVEYVVVGGLAVIMHGHLRATRDLDLVIGLQPDNCARAMDALSGIGLRPRLPVTLADAVIKELDGIRIPVASIRHLIVLKQAAGRPRDMDDIEALREIAAETGQEIQ